MGLLMMSNGTRSEAGQIPGTLAEIARGGQNPGFQVLYPLPFNNGCPHGWERELFLKKKVTAL